MRAQNFMKLICILCTFVLGAELIVLVGSLGGCTFSVPVAYLGGCGVLKRTASVVIVAMVCTVFHTRHMVKSWVRRYGSPPRNVAQQLLVSIWAVYKVQIRSQHNWMKLTCLLLTFVLGAELIVLVGTLGGCTFFVPVAYLGGCRVLERTASGIIIAIVCTFCQTLHIVQSWVRRYGSPPRNVTHQLLVSIWTVCNCKV